VVVRVDGRSHPVPGDLVTMALKADHVHLFDPGTGARL
jgi:hypothetical protein